MGHIVEGDPQRSGHLWRRGHPLAVAGLPCGSIGTMLAGAFAGAGLANPGGNGADYTVVPLFS